MSVSVHPYKKGMIYDSETKMEMLNTNGENENFPNAKPQKIKILVRKIQKNIEDQQFM
jgi:hypothetical protein